MNDLTPVFNCLVESDQQKLQAISAQLADAWGKRQIYRTNTEARFSVLNDANFPTTASKYWQCVREQTAMLDNLTIMSFDMRRNQIELQRAQMKVAEADNKIDREAAQIDVDECLWKAASAEQVANDRVREIVMWEGFKLEYDDGTFDTQNVDTHQRQSLMRQLQNRAQCLTEHSPPGEILNVMGPLETMKKAIAIKG